jgi:hypothetical protein
MPRELKTAIQQAEVSSAGRSARTLQHHSERHARHLPGRGLRPFTSITPSSSEESEEEAVAPANDSPFGLAGRHPHNDVSRARRGVATLQCGIVSINDHHRLNNGLVVERIEGEWSKRAGISPLRYRWACPL